MNFPWMTFVNFGGISAALLLATLIRARVRFFQKYLIPNALTAGFILLVFYNYAAPHIGMTQADLGGFAYHLLNLSFIAMVLRKPADRGAHSKKRSLTMAVAMLSQYAIQAVLGLGLTWASHGAVPDLLRRASGTRGATRVPFLTVVGAWAPFGASDGGSGWGMDRSFCHDVLLWL